VTSAEAAGSATIARLSCTYAFARDAGEDPALRDRLDRVLSGGLGDAVAATLAELDRLDQGAVWVVRTLQADIVVSSAIDDLDVLAGEWGRQLGGAILATLRAGPGGNVVRFASRAAYVAAFAAALAMRSAETWIFEPLAGLRLLAPATAIRAACNDGRARVAGVIAELGVSRRIETVLAASTAAEIAALWAACLAEAPAGAPSRSLVEALRAQARAAEEPALWVGATPERAIRLLAAAPVTDGRTENLVAAVSVAAASLEAPFDVAKPARSRRAEDGEPDAPPARPALSVVGEQVTPVRSPPAATSGVGVYAAAGAPAFLLLPILERVGLDAVAADARSRVLRRALGLEHDAAIELASGGGGPDDTADPRELLDAVFSALLRERRIDGRWFSTERVPHPDGRRVVSLVRDVESDTWLAATLHARRSRTRWRTLLDLAVTAAGREPEAVFGSRPAGRPVDAVSCTAALERLRPPALDVEWLSPGDDRDLAAGLAARVVMRSLAGRLLGFGRSPLSYLAERVVPPGGVIVTTEDRIHADLPSPPLAVLLAMAGLETISYRVRWLEQEVLVTHRGAGGE
jgi:hypothetical protein